jgi:LysR family glycine cleavage system transcriptional activator
VGQPLFNRRSNGISLTQAGRHLANRLTLAFDQMLVASLSARDPLDQAVVTIQSQFSMASRWLTSRVSRFREAYPHIQVTVVAVPRDYPKTISAPDLWIYHYSGPESGVRLDRLLHGNIIAVGSPRLADALPQHCTAADLLDQPLIETRYIDPRWTEPGWPDWFAASGLGRVEVRPATVFNLSLLAIEACLAGAGFALVPDFMVEKELESGSLKQVLNNNFVMNQTYFLFTPEANLMREEVSLLRTWLLENNAKEGGS